MKNNTKFILFMFLWGLSACSDKGVDLPRKDLEGKANGNTWTLKYASAQLVSTDSKYEIKFYDKKEQPKIPCDVAFPSASNLSVILRLQVNSYSLPFPNIFETVIFNYSDGKKAMASSGFLEIFQVFDGRVKGYLQAKIDDANTVEGRFEVEICPY